MQIPNKSHHNRCKSIMGDLVDKGCSMVPDVFLYYESYSRRGGNRFTEKEKKEIDQYMHKTIREMITKKCGLRNFTIEQSRVPSNHKQRIKQFTKYTLVINENWFNDKEYKEVEF